ncbi:anthranilate phosphoribosyltransferase [Aureibacillus halotolerans]|uniref:Anthranilate phosphoribosyltransferase n=1 Tax=Aureibacillus halotolerans TaxID=1508390 RepID=A0A4R6U6Y5_9BACI|nr:anthranilate phosphoribosyltransferase [Aureibacillus halotolerans]TDQ41526.1 anthranilate phosphoribosyltransferase [Aureibacillus halotolerans]
MFKSVLQAVIQQEVLTVEDAEKAMNIIMEGNASPSQIAGFLTALRLRGETVDEIVGFTRSLRSHMTTVNGIDTDTVDTCGTGGDAANTFNISTASSLVVASHGVKVAKHGNLAVSSKSGSADVLKTLGVNIQQNADEARKALAAYNMTFLFAPLYHQAMKHAVVPRKELGFRTVFNILGPLANPARCKRQLIGVYDHEQAKKMASALRILGSSHVMLVTGEDGLDEATITGKTNVVELKNGDITTFQIHPEDFGLEVGSLKDIQSFTPEESAQTIESVLLGKAHPSARNIVALNAGASLYVSGAAATLSEGVMLALETVQTGNAYKQLERMKEAAGTEEERTHA